MATAGKFHREAILQHRRQMGSSDVYKLYAKICDYHQRRDASQRDKAWMQFLTTRKSATEPYMSYYRRVEAAYGKIDRTTPADQSLEDWAKELTLFTFLSRLPHDDMLRTSLTTQKDLSLKDAASAILRFDSSFGVGVGVSVGDGCWTWGDKNRNHHQVTRDCPHRVAGGGTPPMVTVFTAKSEKGSGKDNDNARANTNTRANAKHKHGRREHHRCRQGPRDRVGVATQFQQVRTPSRLGERCASDS